MLGYVKFCYVMLCSVKLCMCYVKLGYILIMLVIYSFLLCYFSTSVSVANSLYIRINHCTEILNILAVKI